VLATPSSFPCHEDTDPEIVVEAFHGPQLFRVFMGHAPVTAKFANSLASVFLGPRR